MMPRSTVVASVIQIEMSRFFFMVSSRQPDARNEHVDQLDSDKRNDDSAETVDEQVAAQKRFGSKRPIPYAAERERNKRDDNKGVENYRRKHRRLGRFQAHDVQNVELRERAGEHGGNDREILGHVVGYRKSGQRTARD